MQLRSYQTNLISQVKQSYLNGYSKPCIVLGCGGGKSIIVADMAKRTTDNNKRVLFIVHRQELCEQIRETFTDYGVNMDLCQIGMVQTITKRLSNTVKPDLIIVDENHHSVCKTYKRIFEHFADVKCIGVTATPIRLNGGGLGDINDILLVGVSTKYLIENNFLASFDYYAPPVADLSSLSISKGDYITSEIETIMDKPKIHGDVIRYYKQLSDGKQAICYCASITHSKHVSEEFNQNGIVAAHIDGTTPTEQRNVIIDGFRSGMIKVLCNVDLISEGFDVPDCNTSILLRPTQSLVLFIQQSMRCMRYKLGKRALIIDHVGNYARFGLPDDDREWSLAPRKISKLNEVPVKQCVRCFYTFKPTPKCPNCGYENPKTERELKEERMAELVKIEAVEKKQKRMEVGKAKTYEELKQIGKDRGYSPYWARIIAKQKGLM